MIIQLYEKLVKPVQASARTENHLRKEQELIGKLKKKYPGNTEGLFERMLQDSIEQSEKK